MVFSSNIFILHFLPIFLTTYYIVGIRYKNFVLLVFSILFYSWGAPKFIFVILATTIFDFYLVKKLESVQKNHLRRLILGLSITSNIGLLVYFKYSNFFIENINVILEGFGIKQLIWTQLVLPIGISFYTFETITYVLDVYRKVHRPLDNFWDYQLYIILFPKLIAGPIVRYIDIADQIKHRFNNDTVQARLSGFYRFSIGLSKKVLIANQLGFHVDQIFNSDISMLNGVTAWVGIIGYSFQLYFDFSGYSDMAIGLAKMIGFTFPENFNNPYVATSITDFWRRWHISLGTWMKNYLYIPLGGNKRRPLLNLSIVFIVSGFWHGASWNFIFWGFYHGMFLILERLFLLNWYDRTGRLFRTFITFLIVIIGWVFFRIENIEEAFHFLQKLFYLENSSQVISIDFEFLTYLTIATFFSFFTFFKLGLYVHDQCFKVQTNIGAHIIGICSSFILLFLCLCGITAFNFNPFIYFRF